MLFKLPLGKARPLELVIFAFAYSCDGFAVDCYFFSSPVEFNPSAFAVLIGIELRSQCLEVFGIQSKRLHQSREPQADLFLLREFRLTFALDLLGLFVRAKFTAQVNENIQLSVHDLPALSSFHARAL